MIVTFDPTTNYPYPVQLPNDYEMPFRPLAGQVLVYVELKDDPMNALETLKGMGYSPDLRICTYPSGRQPLCALLRYEQHNPDFPVDYKYRSEEELVALTKAFPPQDGLPMVHMASGRPNRKAIAA